MKIGRHIPILVIIGQQYWVLYVKIHLHFLMHLECNFVCISWNIYWIAACFRQKFQKKIKPTFDLRVMVFKIIKEEGLNIA
jgi:hypothetical protein